jgi:hypothetical protein
MILSLKSLASALLVISAAVVSQAQIVVNGYAAAQGNVVRQTSNANVNLNAQFQRTVTAQVSGSQVIYINEIVNVTTTKLGGVIPVVNAQINRAVVYVATYPLPKVFTTKTTTTVGAGFAFTATSAAATFPTALEYNEVNGQDGFQIGADKLVQTFDLKENLNTWSIGAAPTNWNAITLTTEKQPVNSTSNVNATVNVAASCNKVNGFCFQFRFSNSMYLRNGVQYMPDAVKVDIIANTANFNTTNGRLAILSNMLSTADSLNLTDMHTAVDSTMAQAKAANAVALVSADFIIGFNAQNQNSAYLNFARTATLTSAANGNSTVTVNAQVVKNATAKAMVQSMVNVNYNGQAAQIDTNFQSMATVEAIVYSFLADNNGAKSITWDPEFGVANVNTTNQVVGGTTGLSGGAIAGIVIAVFAVAGVAGFFGYRAIKNKRGKSGVFLG